MIKVGRLTDYGTVIMSQMAGDPTHVYSATELAEKVHLPVPTASKLLKRLTKGGLLKSYRGKIGGYQLVREPSKISLAEIVTQLEGEVALTECSAKFGDCPLESDCNVKNTWQRINQILYQQLEQISLAQTITQKLASKKQQQKLIKA